MVISDPRHTECSNLTEANGRKYIYVYTNLPVNAIVRLPHPRSGGSQGQETFLAPSADKQTRNYDTECSNHHPSLSTLRPNIYLYIYIYIYIYICIYIYNI